MQLFIQHLVDICIRPQSSIPYLIWKVQSSKFPESTEIRITIQCCKGSVKPSITTTQTWSTDSVVGATSRIRTGAIVRLLCECSHSHRSPCNSWRWCKRFLQLGLLLWSNKPWDLSSLSICHAEVGLFSSWANPQPHDVTLRPDKLLQSSETQLPERQFLSNNRLVVIVKHSCGHTTGCWYQQRPQLFPSLLQQSSSVHFPENGHNMVVFKQAQVEYTTVLFSQRCSAVQQNFFAGWACPGCQALFFSVLSCG